VTRYNPFSETIQGSDLTGTDAAKNRTYTLSNSGSVATHMQVILQEAILQITENFTFDSDTGVITFLGKVWDSMAIQLDYLTATSTEPSGSYYCDTLQVTRFAGIGVVIELENLGTGDATERSYDLDFGNVIASSYTVKYGAESGATVNSLTSLVEGTDYALDKDSGSLYLTAAGLSTLSTNILYISYTYSPKQSDTVLTSYLPKVNKEVDKITGNYWGDPKTSTQYFDGYQSGYPQTDKPFGNQIENMPEFELDYRGINSITTVEFLDRVGDVSSTVDSDYVSLDEEGRVIITSSQSIPNGKRNVKITFIHGYDDVPELVQELAGLIGGMMALVNISGGSYKDISTYQCGRVNFSRGQIYVNVRESIDQMKVRIKEITAELGDIFACV